MLSNVFRSSVERLPLLEMIRRFTG